MFILNRSTVQHHNLLTIQAHLLTAMNLVEQANRQLGTSTPEQIETLFGIPATSAEALSTLMTNLEDTLASAPVENILSQLS